MSSGTAVHPPNTKRTEMKPKRPRWFIEGPPRASTRGCFCMGKNVHPDALPKANTLNRAAHKNIFFDFVSHLRRFLYTFPCHPEQSEGSHPMNKGKCPDPSLHRMTKFWDLTLNEVDNQTFGGSCSLVLSHLTPRTKRKASSCPCIPQRGFGVARMASASKPPRSNPFRHRGERLRGRLALPQRLIEVLQLLFGVTPAMWNFA